MTTEQIREKLLQLHIQENDLNRNIARLDCEIKGRRKLIATLAKKVSKNMKYRNDLINRL